MPPSAAICCRRIGAQRYWMTNSIKDSIARWLKSVLRGDDIATVGDLWLAIETQCQQCDCDGVDGPAILQAIRSTATYQTKTQM